MVGPDHGIQFYPIAEGETVANSKYLHYTM